MLLFGLITDVKTQQCAVLKVRVGNLSSLFTKRKLYRYLKEYDLALVLQYSQIKQIVGRPIMGP
jgi:hypothetical protein